MHISFHPKEIATETQLLNVCSRIDAKPYLEAWGFRGMLYSIQRDGSAVWVSLDADGHIDRLTIWGDSMAAVRLAGELEYELGLDLICS